MDLIRITQKLSLYGYINNKVNISVKVKCALLLCLRKLHSLLISLVYLERAVHKAAILKTRALYYAYLFIVMSEARRRNSAAMKPI